MLHEIMELREDIEQPNVTDEKLKPLLEECRQKQDRLCESLTKAFRENDVKEAKYLTACLQYWSKIEEKILEKITEV
jgi:DnaJ-domain-containing protein 1